MNKTILTIVMATLCLNFSAKAQEPSKPPPLKNQGVIGKVISASTGESLPGAVIKVTLTKQTIVSNDRGEFIISLGNGTYNLSVHYLNHKTKNITIQIPLREKLIVALETDEQGLKEVEINAGYYTVKDKERTGSISKITAEAIAKQPVANILQALQGRMPGVQIQQTTGFSGGRFNIQIRGQNSLRSEGNAPFYVIDGVPYISTSIGSVAGGTITSGGDPLSSLNPGDIESIEILKDADATAIYGSRGANGVMLITTKKGKKGQTRIDLNVYKGVAQVASLIKLLNSSQYVEMRREAFINDNVTPKVTDYDINGIWDENRYTNWQKELIGGTAGTGDMQVGISGGSELTRFIIRGSYHKETTVLPSNHGNKKYSGLLNLNHSTSDRKFNTQVSVNYALDDNRLVTYDPTSTAINLAPNAPVPFNADGTLNWENGTFENPFAALKSGYFSNNNNIVANAMLSYEFLPGLLIKTSIGYTQMQFKEKTTTPISSRNPNSGINTGSSLLADSFTSTWITEPQLEYKVQLGKGNLNLLLGTTLQKNKYDAEVLDASGFTDDSMLDNLKAAANIAVFSANQSVYKYNAFFGRFNYNWDGKYIINVTGRRDGSSRFGPGNQYANFLAAGAAWIFSHESFIRKTLPLLSFGKLRASYGSTGSDQIGDYGYYDLWNNTIYTYGKGRGVYPINLFNPKYAWERNRKFETELTLGFLNDRITTSIAYYSNRSGNQLVGFPLPFTTGFSSLISNMPAVVQNKGFEVLIGIQNIINRKIKWSTDFNLTIPRNKLLKFPGIESTSYRNTREVGKSLNIVRSYKYLTIDQDKGYYTFDDINNDGKLSSTNDYMSLVERTQKYYGGIQNSLSYKEWNLSVFLQFVKQSGNSYVNIFATPGTMNNQPVIVMDRWQKTGDIKPVQKFSQTTGDTYRAYQNNLRNSNQKITDASFMRLKNLSLSYNLPLKITKAIKSQHARIYLQSQNLFTITNYLGLDPETQSASLPPLRSMTIGFQITF